MNHVFGPQGEAALAEVLGRAPLLAFDFDGTLAPIVARPDRARVELPTAMRLARLGEKLPVAIVTGRALADVRHRLGFTPRFIVGNHGAEDDGDDGNAGAMAALAKSLDPLRELLRSRAPDLAGVGVTVEDKGLSVALHYRLSRRRHAAAVLLHQLLDPLPPQWRRFPGKMVVNVAPAAAPDKADAVHRLVARCGADCAVFAGDDANDEPVFASAPDHWLTVRVGRDDPHTRAHFVLDGPHEMASLLQRMLDHLDGQPRAGPR